jgi:hypothetical protein
MAAHVDPGAFRDALIVLAAAGIVIPLFHRLRLSPVLGYMLVGLAVGPFGLGRAAAALPWLGAVTINDPASIAPIAELGVVMLLFMIGLELSFERLLVMRRLVFGLGALQVFLSTAVVAGLALLAGGAGGGHRRGDVVHRRGDPGAVGGEAAEHRAGAGMLRGAAVPGPRHRAGAPGARPADRRRRQRRAAVADRDQGGAGGGRHPGAGTAGTAPAVSRRRPPPRGCRWRWAR